MFNVNALRKPGTIPAFILFLVLALHGFSVHAELVFRSVEQVDGQQRWSPIKKYSNPSDILYTRGGATAHAEEVRVILSGEVTHRDVESAEIMAKLIKSGKQKIANNTIWFSSNGGDIDAGMELGRQLRALGIDTIVGKNDRCMSACVFAFMGGERRSVAGQLGIHRPFFPFTQDASSRLDQFRHLESTLKNFVEELDFPSSLYEAIMLVPPESVQVVSPADLKRFYLEGISPSSEDRLDAASARRLNLTMFAYLQRKARAPTCAFLDAGQGRCEGRVQETAITAANESAAESAADSLASMSKSELIEAGRTDGSMVQATADAQVVQPFRTNH
ncbi:hypothetical protein [Solimicrobium silvestre]|nr:hypothetical protein [Solimicrobium silvestre]